MQYGQFAEIYDALMTDVPYGKWADFILQNIGQNKRDLTVLELAAGTGNLSVLLSDQVKQWIAGDISEEMLRIAAEKFRRMGKRIPILELDMRDFTLNKQVDAVICACDGINCLTHLADVADAFACVRRALKQSGVFIFDISSAYKLENMADQFFGEDMEELTYIWQNSFDAQSRILTMDIAFFQKQGELYGRFDEQHTQRAHRVDELLPLLRKNAFTEVNVYDNYTFSAPGAESTRITFIAQ